MTLDVAGYCYARGMHKEGMHWTHAGNVVGTSKADSAGHGGQTRCSWWLATLMSLMVCPQAALLDAMLMQAPGLDCLDVQNAGPLLTAVVTQHAPLVSLVKHAST